MSMTEWLCSLDFKQLVKFKEGISMKFLHLNVVLLKKLRLCTGKALHQCCACLYEDAVNGISI